jgi:hypothetical protein
MVEALLPLPKESFTYISEESIPERLSLSSPKSPSREIGEESNESRETGETLK